MKKKTDIRGAIFSALKQLGWAKKSGVSAIRGIDALLAVSFQKSQYESLYFVNIGIWLLALGEPVDFPKQNQCHLQFRIERLLPELSSLLEPGNENLDELEKKILSLGTRLKDLTELNHIRELYKAGSLSNGLIRKEARELLG